MAKQPNVSGRMERSSARLASVTHRDVIERQILEYSKKWQRNLGLGQVAIQHEFNKEFKEGDTEILAETNALWQYDSAITNWYMPAVEVLDDEELETLVVHEHLHISLNPIELHLAERWSEQREFTVTRLAKALVRMSREEEGSVVALPVPELSVVR